LPFLGKAIAGGSIKGGLYSVAENTTWEPFFYLSPCLGSDVSALINELVAGGSRFLVLSSPAEEGSYNCADDEVLCHKIREGARGTYWDIIRRSGGGKQRY
jgi:hypothetical protein